MNPRVFISSTFYDLHSIRRELSNFVVGYGFETVLFEDGDIGYKWGKSLDVSCYTAVRNSDMVILIIGGNYGTPATGETKENFQEYMSITRKEFQTAIEEGIPMYVFVEAEVYSEYKIYEKNKKSIEEQKMPITFSATKDLNVFRFINSISLIRHIAITKFSEVQEIKDFLKKQWADMLKNHLMLLKRGTNGEDIENSIKKMERLIGKMDIMLQNVGKEIFKEDVATLNKVLFEQKVEEIANIIANTFEFVSLIREVAEIRGFLLEFVEKVFSAQMEGILACAFSDIPEDVSLFNDYFKSDKVIITDIKGHIEYGLEEYKNLVNEPEIKEEIVNRLMQEDYLKIMKLWSME